MDVDEEEKVLKKARFVADFVGPSLEGLQGHTDNVQAMCDWRYENGLNYHEMRRRRRFLMTSKNLQILENDLHEFELKYFSRKTRVQLLGYAADVEKQMDPATRGEVSNATPFLQFDTSLTEQNTMRNTFPTTFTYQTESGSANAPRKSLLQEKSKTRMWSFGAQNEQAPQLAPPPVKRQALRTLDQTPRASSFFPR